MARTYKGPFFTSPNKAKLDGVVSTVDSLSAGWQSAVSGVSFIGGLTGGWEETRTIVQNNSASWEEITPINVSNSIGLNTIDAVLSASYEGVVWDLTLKNGLNARFSTVMMVWNSGGEFEFTESSTNDLGSTSVITLSTTMVSNSAILQSSISDGSTWVIKGNRSTIQ